MTAYKGHHSKSEIKRVRAQKGLSRHQHAQGAPLTDDCDLLCAYNYSLYERRNKPSEAMKDG